MSELKSCPFCGKNEATIERLEDGNIQAGYYYIRCGWCGAQSGTSYPKEVAIKDWNTRATDE